MAIKYAPALVSPLTLMCTKPQVELSSAMWTDGRSPAEVLKFSAETSACGCYGGWQACHSSTGGLGASATHAHKGMQQRGGRPVLWLKYHDNC